MKTTKITKTGLFIVERKGLPYIEVYTKDEISEKWTARLGRALSRLTKITHRLGV
jgi:hypothetical protein